MEHTDLRDLVESLCLGNRLHICIIFTENYGNYKTALPYERTVHEQPYCQHVKYADGELARCVACRNGKLRRALTEKAPFATDCHAGVYEYCYPVVEGDAVPAVVFVGNMVRQATARTAPFADTFATLLPETDCLRLCTVLGNHIRLLLREYSDRKQDYAPLVVNIRSLIEENLYGNISVAQIAEFFHYNEKYIGQLFYRHTGKTIKQYIREKRLEKSEQYLREGTLPVTEIATRLGFANAPYFNRLFLARNGMTPTQYRSAHAAEGAGAQG